MTRTFRPGDMERVRCLPPRRRRSHRPRCSPARGDGYEAPPATLTSEERAALAASAVAAVRGEFAADEQVRTVSHKPRRVKLRYILPAVADIHPIFNHIAAHSPPTGLAGWRHRYQSPHCPAGASTTTRSVAPDPRDTTPIPDDLNSTYEAVAPLWRASCRALPPISFRLRQAQPETVRSSMNSKTQRPHYGGTMRSLPESRPSVFAL